MQHQNLSTQKGYALLKAVAFCAVFIGLVIGLSFFKSFVSLTVERFAHGVIGTLAAIITTLLFLRIEKKSFADIGLRGDRGTLLRFSVGVLIGTAVTAALFACLFLFTDLQLKVNAAGDLPQFLLWTLALLPLAFMEEVAFRAYPLSTLSRFINPRVALLVTAVLFALYHIANGWSVFISFLGPGTWALIFGLAAFWSNGIAMPTGIHYATNVVQSAIGMGKGFVPLWTIQQTDVSADAEARTEGIGLAVQIGLLVCAVIAMELYLRRRQASADSLA